MKNLKKICLLFVLCFTSITFAQIINIPDANFKNTLVNSNCATDMSWPFSGSFNLYDVDTNNNGEIEISEAENVRYLSINDEFIISLEGIQYFTNLEYLNCEGNLIANLVLNNDNLEYLDCNSNMLETLNLQDCVSLQTLTCRNNELTTLNLSQNINLEWLSCKQNQISSLDLSNNINLYNVSCGENQMVNLDVSNCVDLNYLYCGENELLELNVSDNVSLNYLAFPINNITSIDISNNPNIDEFYFYNNPLEWMNIKNGSTLEANVSTTYLMNYSYPSLDYICVDADEMSQIQNVVESNVSVNSLCSFVPGGDYNTIIGNITSDSQNDGCDDGDDEFPFIKININNVSETGSAFTASNGEYAFYIQDGTFTVTPDIENPSFFNITPIDATINFPDTNNNVEVQDFCITANGIHPDIEIVIAPSIPARPGFDAEYLITYRNKGNQAVSGDVIFNYDDTVLDYLSSTETPTSQTTGALSWDYSNLLPFESRSVFVTLNVNGPMETPAVNIDDPLSFSATVNPVVGDDSPSDNSFSYRQIVVGSYDPNDIACIEGDVVEPSEIGNYLHYLIRFENTGNAPAENVVVETEVDPTQFNINSLRLLSSSHNVDVRVSDNIIKFIFEGIYLEASGGHGNILLRMKTKPDLEINDTVTKDAKIFFDYNFPIETNDANTTFATLSNSEYELDNSISLYPNPVRDIFSVKAKNVIKSVSLFDVQGRLLQTRINSESEIELDISTRSKGVYFVKILTEKGIKVEKIIKN